MNWFLAPVSMILLALCLLWWRERKMSQREKMEKDFLYRLRREILKGTIVDRL